MTFTLRLRDRFRSKSDKDLSVYSQSPKITVTEDATKAADTNNSRTITFDFDNELTRRRARRSDDEETLAIAPPPYSRRSRDSGLGMGSRSRDSSKVRSLRSRDSSPMSARFPRLSMETDDGRRMSLGPAMEQWRLEEDEEWQASRPRKNHRLSGLLTPALTSSSTLASAPGSPSWGPVSKWPSWASFDEDKARGLSLANAMEQWRLEDDEDAKRTGQAAPSSPTSVLVPASSGWPTPPTLSSTEQDDVRIMTLGPAMEQWRLEEEEELQAPTGKDAALPILALPVSPLAESKWPSQSPFAEDKGKPTNLIDAMEQWRVEEESEAQAPQQEQTEAPSPAPKPRKAWPSLDQGVKKHANLGSAMEQWRLEELDEWKKDSRATAAPLPPRAADLPAQRRGCSGIPERTMGMGRAMEAWRLEMC